MNKKIIFLNANNLNESISPVHKNYIYSDPEEKIYKKAHLSSCRSNRNINTILDRHKNYEHDKYMLHVRAL